AGTGDPRASVCRLAGGPVDGIGTHAQRVPRGAGDSARHSGEHAEESRAFVRLALWAPLAVGNEVHVGAAGAEQEGRIDVGIAGPGPEVERLGAGRPNDLALVDLVATLDANRRQERIAG